MMSPRYFTYAEIAELFDVSKRTVSNWVREHEIPVTAGRPARVAQPDLQTLAAILGRAFPSVPVVATYFGKPEEILGKRQEATRNVREANGNAEKPIEAAYRVTPAEIEQAVSRTSAQYMGDLRAMLAEVGQVYAGQIAAKDEALAAKDQTIAMQAETIAELRRRAEVGAAEVVRRREEQEAVQAAPEAPGTPEAPAEVREDRPRVWRRIRQWWHG